MMFVSLFVPWLMTSGSSLSLFGLYLGIATHSGLPGLSISQASVVFALLTLILSPVALVCGALALVRRRFSLVSGILGVVAGVSIVVILPASTGLGAYGFIAGSAVVLVGFFSFRRPG